MKVSKGFTLIELILVICIIAILIFIASLKLSIVEKYETTMDINLMVKNINKCKNLAIAKKQYSEIDFSKEGSYSYSCGEVVSKDINYHKSINLSPESNISIFKFNNRGVPQFKGSGTLVFNVKNRKYRITVEPVTGKVNLYKGDKDES